MAISRGATIAAYSRELGVGEPGPEGDAEPGVGEALDGEGEGDGEADAEEGLGEADCVCGEADAVSGTGGGGLTCGACWKIRIAISTASAHSNTISNQEARIDSQPARSWRPGQGSGHSLAIPGRSWSTQGSR